MTPTVFQEALDRLENAGDEVILDLSQVRRVQPEDLQALELLAARADKQRVRVVLDAVNVDVYRVLKLAKLTSRFSLRT